jgi:hypothetical protein
MGKGFRITGRVLENGSFHYRYKMRQLNAAMNKRIIQGMGKYKRGEFAGILSFVLI